MDEEILCAVEKNQTAIYCEETFKFNAIESDKEQICYLDNKLIKSDLLSYFSVDDISIKITKPIINFNIENDKIAIVYNDNAAEIFCKEDILKKLNNVIQVLIKNGIFYVLEMGYFIKQINEEEKLISSKIDWWGEPPILIWINEDIHYLMGSALYSKDGNLLFKPCKMIIQLANQNFVVLNEKNNKFMLNLCNSDFSSKEELILGDEWTNCICKVFQDYFIISTTYKIYVFKDTLELVDAKEYSNLIKGFTIQDSTISVLLGEKAVKEKKTKKKIKEIEPDKIFNASEEMKYHNEIFNKLILLIKEEKKERKLREELEKKKFEMFLEKMNEQINSSFKNVIESVLKKELPKFNAKNLENNISTSIRKTVVDRMLPIITSSLTDLTAKSKNCICKSSSNSKRGIELVLDSSEQVFEDFLKDFNILEIQNFDSHLTTEMYIKTLLCKSISIDFKNKIFNEIIFNNQKLQSLIPKLSKETISLMPQVHLIGLLLKIHSQFTYEALILELLKHLNVYKMTNEELESAIELFNLVDESPNHDQLVKGCVNLHRCYAKDKKCGSENN